MKLIFDFRGELCSACGGCAVACMDQNDIDVEAGQQPYRKVYSLEENGQLLSLSVACLHCSEPPCVAACPVHCLEKDPHTGLTRLDNTGCIGCHACQRACPYDAPTFRPTGLNRPREKMEKCHGCPERMEAGKLPACIMACPTGALTCHWGEEGEHSQADLGALVRQALCR
jgi:Fe-S-cluster-containing dehydrogenase component